MFKEAYKLPEVAEKYDELVTALSGRCYIDDIEELLSLAQFHPDDTVIDLGCGTGISTEVLIGLNPRPKRIIACDSSPEMLKYARQKLEDEVEFFEVAGENLSSIGETNVDKVVAINSFSYMSSDRTLQEVHRVLKRGGEFITQWALPGPQLDAYIGDIIVEVINSECDRKITNEPYPTFKREEIEELARRNGFNVRNYQEYPVSHSFRQIRDYSSTLADILARTFQGMDSAKRERVSRSIISKTRRIPKLNFANDAGMVLVKE